MRSLSAMDIVGVWELCEHQAPITRALTILRAACPEMSADQLARLSVGERDMLLLLVRRHMLGPKLESIADCPACAERLEFTLNADDLLSGARDRGTRDYELAADDYRIRYRLLDSYDIIDVAASPSVDDAREALLERAVLSAECDGVALTAGELPTAVVERLAAAITEVDPQAEVLLNLDCPACDHSWQVLFDIATYLWDELQSRAVELLRDVHFIAIRYGWSEEAILAMSATKRRLYLEM